MSRPGIVVQARMGSTRFPGKVLADLGGAPLLARLLERLALVPGTALAVATSTEPADDPIAALAAGLGVPCVRGPLEDVLARFVLAARELDLDPVVRITGDCPLADPGLIAELLDVYRDADPPAAYVSNVRPPTFPDGLDVEIVSRAALERADRESTDPVEREHVTTHVARRPERYRQVNVVAEDDRSGERWTVDYPADLELVRAVYAELYPLHGAAFGRREVRALLDARPELAPAGGPEGRR
jgi:spore coat polysaccharide biosynthesis protein SpsF (cytidylyltransferase family)